MKWIFYAIFFFNTSQLLSQRSELSYSLIPDSLKINANAVVRLEHTDLEIKAQDEMLIHTKRVVTVLNEKGLGAIQAVEYYSKSRTIKSIEAIVISSSGQELKKFRKKDFRDQSAVDGISIAVDVRLMYLDYTPSVYPFTMIFETEIETVNTAFIPAWMPLDDFYTSVEKSIFNVSCLDRLGLQKLESNLSLFNVEKTVDKATQLTYIASNIAAQRSEYFSPDLSTLYPKVLLGLEYFHLEGVDGNAKDWREFGKWYSEKILSGTTELPKETIIKIKELVADEKDPIEKARKVYAYVQEKSRYVSIQLGIGGWKPMMAKDVDRLGYGDCKALTNYTKALLNVVDVPSYNTILFGDANVKKNIESNIVSVQGNHMILAIPDGKSFVWLECTSQDTPFGYQANFTDDRKVIVIKPDDAEIVTTKKYDNTDNIQTIKGVYRIAEDGNLSGEVVINSEGAVYGLKYYLENSAPDIHEKYYKNYWSKINNLKINSISFQNDKKNVIFTENIAVEATAYASFSEGKMLVTANVFNPFIDNVKRSRNRKLPFDIQRGFIDQDEFKVTIPKTYEIESLPKQVVISSSFGAYLMEITKIDEDHLLYRRSFSLKKGLYKNSEYESYRLFLEQVARNDNSKFVLIKKT